MRKASGRMQTKGKKITISTSIGDYSIIFTDVLTAGISKYISENINNLAIVTDNNILKYYDLKKLLGEKRSENIYSVNPGEESKKFSQYSEIIKTMVENRFTRMDSALIAVGGGVISDLGGFIASTYMRGIMFFAIPTSLLGMIDASIGGKNAINTGFAKNIIGTFYNPGTVIIDVGFLKTLPDSEWINGFVEMIKYGVILDASFFAELESFFIKNIAFNEFPIKNLIIKSIKIKKSVVEKDLFDDNYRNVLNFGHTIGHGIETGSGYTIPHGIAVGFGMICEAFLSVKIKHLPEQDFKRIKSILLKLGIMAKIRGIKPDDVVNALYLDKKSLSSGIRMVLIERIGKVCQKNGLFTHSVKKSDILEALEFICSA